MPCGSIKFYMRFYIPSFSKPTSELDPSPVGNNFLSGVSGSSLPQLVQGSFLPETELCTPVGSDLPLNFQVALVLSEPIWMGL